ncbi:MAG: cell division protein ZapA [Succinatimonas sp.]|nr:cell division protein ZapA [Succinatimonas sp.]
MQDTNSNNDETETVSFVMMGISFNLRVKKSESKALLKAAHDVQQRSASLLRSNPSLTTQQAAILVALNVQSDLNNLLTRNTPFEEQALSLIGKAREYLVKY